MHLALITQILAIHAISGCDTVAACYGIGKTTTVTISKKGFLLNSLGVIDVLWDNVVKETTEFMVAAYSGSGVTMSECRQCLWMAKDSQIHGCPQSVFLATNYRSLCGKHKTSTLPNCTVVCYFGFRSTTL